MKQVGCSVVMLNCAAVYRGVYMEKVGCSVVMLHCAAVDRGVIWKNYAVLLLRHTLHSMCGYLYEACRLFCSYVALCSSIYWCIYGASRLICCYVTLCKVYRVVYMEQVGYCVVMLHCGAVDRGV